MKLPSLPKSFFTKASSISLFFTFLLIFIAIFAIVRQVQKTQSLQGRAQVVESTAKEEGKCNISQSEIKLDKEEKKLLSLLNKYRKDNRLNALKEDTTLTKAAAWMSFDMAARDYFSHKDALGRLQQERLIDCGYEDDPDAKENIANTYETAEEVMDAWQKSKEHDHAMLTDGFKIAGVARHYDKASKYGWYWTLDMGTAKSSGRSPTNGKVPTATPKPGKKDKGKKKEGRKQGERKGNNDGPTQTPTPTTPQSGTLLKLSVAIPGYRPNSKVVNAEREIQVSIYDLLETEVGSATSTLKPDATGRFQAEVDPGADFEPGTYIIKVKLNNSLRKNILPEFQQIKKDTTNVLPPITLYQGDLDQNNVLNITDFNAFLACLEAECPEEDLVDLNGDGFIDILDYNVIYQTFSTAQGS